MKKGKSIALVLILTLLATCVVGTTIAWLTDKTTTVTNTFSPSTIDIDLTETTGTEYDMVPGKVFDKDPTVKVVKNSEACWLFVKVETVGDVATYLDYSIADGWEALDGVDGVYYRTVAETAEDQTFPVLTDSKVTVKTSVTKDEMDALLAEGATMPQLKFTAYAIQQASFTTATAAWTEASK